MKVKVSVPGKIHLMGEHAVVYGKPALLAAVNRRMVVTVESRDIDGMKKEESENIQIATTEPNTYVLQIIEVVKKTLDMSSLPAIQITIDSAITPGYHLGSSAATAVGVTAALVYFLKKLWNPTRINEIAYEAEKLQHGTPSGGDNTAVCFGGLLWFRKELEFLKSMWHLPFAIDSSLQHFFLIDTGRPIESTRDMIAIVREQAKRNPQKMSRLLSENEMNTKQVAMALKGKSECELLSAIHSGEKTLESMGVVSLGAKRIIRAIETCGGAAKILGGGGRQKGVGYLLCYHAHKASLPSSIIQKIIPITLGEEGIRLEQKE